MRLKILSLFLAFLVGMQASRLPSPFGHRFLANDCLIEAVEAQSVYAAKTMMRDGTWTRIVGLCVISFTKKPTGHAVCVFQLPQGGSIWVYDALHGSRKLDVPPYTHDISMLSHGLHKLDRRYFFMRFLDQPSTYNPCKV